MSTNMFSHNRFTSYWLQCHCVEQLSYDKILSLIYATMYSVTYSENVLLLPWLFMHYYCRGVEQCCVNEAGLGGMVPWVRCLQGTGVMFKLYRLPVQAAADQIWTNQKDNWTGEKYTHSTSFYINLWATIAYLLLNMPSTDFSYFQPAMRLIFQHRANGSETVRKQVIHSIV